MIDSENLTNHIADQFPINENLQYVDSAMIRQYLEMLFGACPYNSEHFVIVRGIGEKGTRQEGIRRDEYPIQMINEDFVAGHVCKLATVLAPYHTAVFISPVVFHDSRGIADHVESMPVILIDLDSGDIEAKLKHIEEAIGEASMVVASGGKTKEGKPKMHAYWALSEPVGDIADGVAVRDKLALKGGGDRSFGRPHQVVRVPGTCHAKNGVATMSTILRSSGGRYDFYELAAKVDAMGFAPGVDAPAIAPLSAACVPLAFAPDHSNIRPDISDSLLSTIHEGGDERNRWSEFSRVAGYHIHLARQGKIDIDEARTQTIAWMELKMVPPWPLDRFDTEWRNLIRVDITKNGPPPMLPALPMPASADHSNRIEGFKFIHVSELMEKPKPTPWLIEGIMEQGSLTQLFGDSGSGKSFLAIDWAFCIATGIPWHDHDVEPGAVFYIMGEGHSGIGKRLRALEINHGIDAKPAPLYFSASPASLMDEANAKNVAEAVNALAEKHGPPRLIVVDTLARNLGNGDENSNKEIGLFINNLDVQLRTRFNAAVLIVHHSGHMAKERGRGASALRAAMDHEYRLDCKDMGRVLVCTKAKESEPPKDISFKLVQVALDGWTTDDGEVMTSAVLVPKNGPSESSKPRLRGANRAALSALVKAVEQYGMAAPAALVEKLGPAAPDKVVTDDAWRSMAYETASNDKTQEAKRKAFARAKDALLFQGVICGWDDDRGYYYWPSRR